MSSFIRNKHSISDSTPVLDQNTTIAAVSTEVLLCPIPSCCQIKTEAFSQNVGKVFLLKVGIRELSFPDVPATVTMSGTFVVLTNTDL